MKSLTSLVARSSSHVFSERGTHQKHSSENRQNASFLELVGFLFFNITQLFCLYCATELVMSWFLKLHELRTNELYTLVFYLFVDCCLFISRSYVVKSPFFKHFLRGAATSQNCGASFKNKLNVSINKRSRVAVIFFTCIRHLLLLKKCANVGLYRRVQISKLRYRRRNVFPTSEPLFSFIPALARTRRKTDIPPVLKKLTILVLSPKTYFNPATARTSLPSGLNTKTMFSCPNSKLVYFYELLFRAKISLLVYIYFDAAIDAIDAQT